MQILKFDALVDVPWKNGGGTTRNIAKGMRDVANLDIHGRWVKQVQPATRQHPLPSSWLLHRHFALIEN